MSEPTLAPRPPKGSYPPLSLAVRVLLLAVGWALVLLGLAGLVLPGLQGFLTLLAAAACLSAGSATAHRFLRERFRRWPKGWRRLEKGRRRLHGWFKPKPPAG